MLDRRPDLLSQAAWIFRAYFEIDRLATGFGVGPPSFRGMCDVLDELGITGRERRAEIRGHWRAMAAVESEVQKEKHERAEEERDRDRDAESGGPKHPSRLKRTGRR